MTATRIPLLPRRSSSGAIPNKASPAAVVLVTTTIGGRYQDVGDTYEVRVSGGVDFTMVALDDAEDTRRATTG